MENKTLTAKELQEKLTYSVSHMARKDAKLIQLSKDFSEGYKAFLDTAKTERLAVDEIEKIALENGYTEFSKAKEYKAGDKVYLKNRGRSMLMSTIGETTVDNGTMIIASHLDAPRLDLKPMPLYEKSELAYFKTHYYGGVKRYQWAATPLALHGVVVNAKGETIKISVGEEQTDPVFVITDLLPHLAKDQGERKMRDVLKGEEMNVLIASIPYPDEEIKDAVKLAALELMYNKYGITERDFISAELELVPAGKSRDVGFDRSLVGGYAQDDRVCSYASLMAEIETKNPVLTTITMFADKEETGSAGVTGLKSDFLEHFIIYLSQMQNVNYITALGNSVCLSADVNAAYDPTFPDVHDPLNACYMNKGVVVTKYTGSGGKGGTNDAGAELVAKITNLLDEKNVAWQTGLLGKVDQGGGGTVAQFVAAKNIDTIDIGVPILSMHAPFELASKLDIYATYQAFIAFYNN